MSTELLSESGLSLDRLNSFCLVAEAGGVTKAAHGDPTRQSLYSRQISDLEKFFGTELMRRNGRGIVLTEAGQRLTLIAREYFSALSDFKTGCSGRPVEIVVGAGDSLIQWLLLPRLDEIRKRLPKARFKFVSLSTSESVKSLADGLVDFALVRRNAIAPPLQAIPLGAMRYSLFVPSALMIGRSPKVVLKSLHSLPLATLSGDGAFRGALAGAARKQSVSLNICLECSSFPMAARAVIKGNMAAILPSIAAVEILSSEITEIPAPFLHPFKRDLCLASNSRLARIRPALETARAVLAQVCKF